MSSLERIRSYINTIKIRKAIVGGYDREDVYIKMNGLVDVFREYVKEEVEENEFQKIKAEKQIQQQKAEIEEYKKQLANSQMLIKDLQKKLDEVSEKQIETEQEMESLRDTYKKYCTNILDQYSGSLRTLSGEFSKILENISVLQQNIVEMDSIEAFEVSLDELDIKETLELPDLGIDIEEWLHGDEITENK